MLTPAPRLVLMHGLLDSPAVFNALTRELAGHLRHCLADRNR
jgi:hypothetical protein